MVKVKHMRVSDEGTHNGSSNHLHPITNVGHQRGNSARRRGRMTNLGGSHTIPPSSDLQGDDANLDEPLPNAVAVANKCGE